MRKKIPRVAIEIANHPGFAGQKTDLVYTEEDNKAIENHIRKYVASTWHGLGTLAMKPREDGGVVDKDLNVYGVANLKVAGELNLYPPWIIIICSNNTGYTTDMSICPTNGKISFLSVLLSGVGNFLT